MACNYAMLSFNRLFLMIYLFGVDDLQVISYGFTSPAGGIIVAAISSLERLIGQSPFTFYALR